MVMEMNRQEMAQYKELCEEIGKTNACWKIDPCVCVEGEINKAQKRIATYKEEFANAKEIRQHRQGIEGDLIHRIVMMVSYLLRV